MDWLSAGEQVVGAAIGTGIGGVGAYIAVRVDIASLIAQVAALEKRLVERLALVEKAVDKAHERIDSVVDRTRK